MTKIIKSIQISQDSKSKWKTHAKTNVKPKGDKTDDSNKEERKESLKNWAQKYKEIKNQLHGDKKLGIAFHGPTLGYDVMDEVQKQMDKQGEKHIDSGDLIKYLGSGGVYHDKHGFPETSKYKHNQEVELNPEKISKFKKLQQFKDGKAKVFGYSEGKYYVSGINSKNGEFIQATVSPSVFNKSVKK